MGRSYGSFSRPWAAPAEGYSRLGQLQEYWISVAAGFIAKSTVSTVVLRLDARHPECMKVREALRLLRRDGWKEVTRRGSHRQLKHPSKPGRVTVAGKPSDDLAPGTLKSILKQADLKDE